MNLKTNETGKNSFDQLYMKYYNRFLRFANSYVRDSFISEDIVNESIIYYLERKGQLNDNSNIPAYILATIKNKCLNYLRHQHIREEYSDSVKLYYEWELNSRITSLQACEPNELFLSEIEELIEQSLALMPQKSREIFILNRYENKTYREISVLMGITMKGVEFHISKALKVLHYGLKDYFPLFLYFLSKLS
ncbi:MAG: RNA polymerase sigma-70 factor [Phocaeicola sp.]